MVHNKFSDTRALGMEDKGKYKSKQRRLIELTSKLTFISLVTLEVMLTSLNLVVQLCFS